ncbi:MAG: glycosyltransferase [Candidatus Thorarchaeota archaeon]|jgi:glycosyltransferase involved in cell wall biosynthesis
MFKIATAMTSGDWTHMKICMIEEIANCAYHLTSGLTRKGHKVYVMLDTQRRLDRLLFTHNVPQGAELFWIRPWPIRPRALGLLVPMLRTILRLRPRIIHAQYLWSQFFIGFIAAKLLRIPMVATGHGWEVLQVPNDPIRGRIQKMFLKRTDMVILTADYYHKYMEGLVPSENRVYIPRMIDTDFFRPGIPVDDLLEKYGNRIVTFVARLHKIKTPDKTLRAFRLALDEFPDANLLILGKGEEEQNMKKMVIELKMERSVHFLGEVPNTEIPRYLNASRVEARGFNPATPELGISHLEALACETPVLTYNDYPDVEGMIICLEVPDIAKALRNILRDEKLQKRLGEAGRRYVMKNFSIDAATEMTIRVYQDVLKRRGQNKKG